MPNRELGKKVLDILKIYIYIHRGSNRCLRIILIILILITIVYYYYYYFRANDPVRILFSYFSSTE